METQNFINEKLKMYYSIIFFYHKENWSTTITKIKEVTHDVTHREKYINTYITTVNTLEYPSIASIDFIKKAAHLTINGILEWSYTERNISSLTLGEISHEILELLQSENKSIPLPNKIVNILHSNQAQFIESIENYHYLSHDDKRNIGGIVAIVDTNWEFQKASPGNENLIFRTPTDLNFSIIEDFLNIFALAEQDTITITSIKIK